MGIFDFLHQRASLGNGREPSGTATSSETHRKGALYDDVALSLSSKDSRHAIRVLEPGFQFDVHAAVKGEAIDGLPPMGNRGARAIYGALLELDNGNILVVRHRVDEGDKLGVLSTRDAEGKVVPTERKTFRVTIGSELGESFGVDAAAKVRAVYLVGSRLHPSFVANMRLDSIGEVINASLLRPSDRLAIDEVATSVVEEAYVRTSTGKVYRLRGVGDGTVVADSAFDLARGDASKFLVRMESLHVGQTLSLSAPSDPATTFQTAKVMEVAVKRKGAPDERFDVLRERFNITANPDLQDETKKVVEVPPASK